MSSVIYAETIATESTIQETEGTKEIINGRKNLISSEIIISNFKKVEQIEEDNEEQKLDFPTPQIQNNLIPQDAVKLNKDQILPILLDRISFTSWTWIKDKTKPNEQLKYFSIYTYPETSLDDKYININYNQKLFNENIYYSGYDKILKTLKKKFIPDLTTKLLNEEYYYVKVRNDGGLDLYTEYKTGSKTFFNNLWIEKK